MIFIKSHLSIYRHFMSMAVRRRKAVAFPLLLKRRECEIEKILVQYSRIHIMGIGIHYDRPIEFREDRKEERRNQNNMILICSLLYKQTHLHRYCYDNFNFGLKYNNKREGCETRAYKMTVVHELSLGSGVWVAFVFVDIPV